MSTIDTVRADLPSLFWGPDRTPGEIESEPVVRIVRAEHGAALLGAESFRGDLSLTVKPDDLLLVAQTLKIHPDLRFDMLMDVAGLDQLLLGRQPRFHAVYHFYSTEKKKRVRLHVPLDDANPSVDSLTPLYKSANWGEREAYDMFGIRFVNHPDLRRILTHEEFVGYPLRKDYPADRRHMLSRAYSSYPGLEAEHEGRHSLVDAEGVERVYVNLGPSHPVTHGTIRLQALMDGEIISECRTEIGYLHRCFEKMVETHQYMQAFPYTDRLNYISAFTNNVGYAMTVEKLMQVEVPPRAVWIRLVLLEFNRIMDHLVCIGPNLVDIGALTNFWYVIWPRELIYELLESCCGARLTVSYGRVGGVAQDIPDGFLEHARSVANRIPEFIDYVDQLITRNVIFQKRTRGVGIVTRENAISWGWTGPCARASGVNVDLRREAPYYGYETLDFEIPVRNDGDTFARYIVRMREMRESLRIIHQLLDRGVPEGPYISPDHRVALPEKNEVYTNIEALMNHFKLVMHGFAPPVGEVYSYHESPNGELGFYLVSDGSGKPYRLKVRPPCFYTLAANDEIMRGHMVADFAAIFGTYNIIAGELDR
ncbi:MAG: NADH-quinone oxidoreductase subunit D [Candidatus Eiseniibacteriota bacterium]